MLYTALPRDTTSAFLPPGSPSLHYSEKAPDDWFPFNDHAEFELTDLLYTQIQISNSNLNKLLDIFTAYLYKHGDRPPFSNCAELHSVIDSLQVGEAGWELFGVKFSGDHMENPASWMDDIYNVWMCNSKSAITQILSSADFNNLMHFIPYREYDTATNSHCWQDFMSGDWAWDEVVSSSLRCIHCN